jgi:mycothiol synthase
VNLRLHGLGKGDISAWNQLLADIEWVDNTGEHYNAADLLEEMENPEITADLAVLARAMLGRAVEVHHERHPDVPALYTLRGLTSNVDQAELMASIGLEPERWSFVMRADLSSVPQPGPLPDGLVLERYDEAMAEAMRDAHNAAFLGLRAVQRVRRILRGDRPT